MNLDDALKCADDPESNSVVETTLAAEVRRQREEIEQLRTRAGMMLSGEPVAWVDADGDVYKEEPTENWCPPHTPLYLHPFPAHAVAAPAVPEEWREVMAGLVAIAEKKGKKQGSPNHCHQRPGIWDDDNGPVLSGKPCAECAMYDKARALLQSAGGDK